MTQEQAIAYAVKNWGWEKRDATLARNRWSLLGGKVIALIEQETGAEVEPLTVAEEMHYYACQPQAAEEREPVTFLDRVAMVAAVAATVAGFAFPYFLT